MNHVIFDFWSQIQPTITMEAADVNWELEEGVPQVEDPFIQKYLSGRDALILHEQKQRHG